MKPSIEPCCSIVVAPTTDDSLSQVTIGVERAILKFLKLSTNYIERRIRIYEIFFLHIHDNFKSF